jgi:hypothetical protein
MYFVAQKQFCEKAENSFDTKMRKIASGRVRLLPNQMQIIYHRGHEEHEGNRRVDRVKRVPPTAKLPMSSAE